MLKIKIAIASVFAFTAFGAQATETPDPSMNREIRLACEFPGKDDHHCRAVAVLESREATNNNRLVVRCGRHEVYDGRFDIDRNNGGFKLTPPHGSDTALRSLKFDEPKGDLPTRVDSELNLRVRDRHIELDGECRLSRDNANGMGVTPTDEMN